MWAKVGGNCSHDPRTHGEDWGEVGGGQWYDWGIGKVLMLKMSRWGVVVVVASLGVYRSQNRTSVAQFSVVFKGVFTGWKLFFKLKESPGPPVAINCQLPASKPQPNRRRFIADRRQSMINRWSTDVGSCLKVFYDKNGSFCRPLLCTDIAQCQGGPNCVGYNFHGEKYA